MPIVTIARQLGAGGETIAQRLSDTLGWRLLDRALVDRIAEELEMAPEQVEATSERVEGFMERLGLYLAEGLPEALPVTIVPSTSSEATARAARRLVAALAEEGPAVIVGHGAMCVLRDRLDAMHVFVHAPFETRVGRAVAFFEVDREGAEEKRRAPAGRGPRRRRPRLTPPRRARRGLPAAPSPRMLASAARRTACTSPPWTRR
jgi:cytidylate kinase